MPKPTAKNVAEVLGPMLDHLKQAEDHLDAAAGMFSKLPRSLPNGTRRMDKIVAAVNQFKALRFDLIVDAHEADWCTDEIHDELTRLQNEHRKKHHKGSRTLVP
jgi:hypothetical protein